MLVGGLCFGTVDGGVRETRLEDREIRGEVEEAFGEYNSTSMIFCVTLFFSE